MKFTEAQLNSFISLYERIYGEKLSIEEAEKQAFALVALVKMIYKPMTRREFKKYNEM